MTVRLLLAVLLAGSAWQHAVANPLQALRDAGHVSVDARLQPDNGIVPGQKVRLQLEVAVDTWFTGGTRITIPEVPGLVILQTEQFAANASETRQGTTWVIQRWTLDLYPQRVGEFALPPIAMRIKVNGGREGDVSGELLSPAVRFKVDLPAALQAAQDWVASPDFSAAQAFDRDLAQLAVGDAFEREVILRASDVMAMMLPAFEVEDLPGLAAYAEPPRLDNSVNRGQALASRQVRVSYVAEAPGNYLLPEREYLWWNTDTRELQLVTLPAVSVDVAGASEGRGGTAWLQPRQLAPWLGGLVLLALLLLALRRYLPRLQRGSRIHSGVAHVAAWLRELRRPALPRRLNPGNSAGE